MPDFTITEPGFSGFYGPYLAGDSTAPQGPPTSPLTLTDPGVYRRRVPLDITSVALDCYGQGGQGAVGRTNGGHGAGGGGHAACTLGGPLFVAGSVLIIEIDPLGTDGAGTGGTVRVSVGTTEVLNATGGATGGTAGTGTVAGAAGITAPVTNAGVAGSANVGTTGGAGGAGGGGGGGAGGAGGAPSADGSPGLAPGGGGGGGGGVSGTRAGGSPGAPRVTITW